MTTISILKNCIFCQEYHNKKKIIFKQLLHERELYLKITPYANIAKTKRIEHGVQIRQQLQTKKN